MLYNLENVSANDWKNAEEFFRKNPTKHHLKKGTNGVTRSFDMFNGEIFAEGRILGSGGFGKVKIAQNKKGECYALKIQKDQLGLPSVVPNEIQVLKEVGGFKDAMDRTWRDPHKPKPFPFCFMSYKDGVKHCILMELCEGDSLDKAHIKSLSETQRLLIALQSAKRLQRIHQKGIIHADIKGPNMLAKVNGQEIAVAICDHGISKILPKGQTEVIAESIGTRGYMAPEISVGKFSHASDIYALNRVFRVDLNLLCASVSDKGSLANMVDNDPAKRPTIDQVINTLIVELEKRPDLDANGRRIINDAKNPAVALPRPFIVPRHPAPVPAPKPAVAVNPMPAAASKPPVAAPIPPVAPAPLANPADVPVPPPLPPLAPKHGAHRQQPPKPPVQRQEAPKPAVAGPAQIGRGQQPVAKPAVVAPKQPPVVPHAPVRNNVPPPPPAVQPQVVPQAPVPVQLAPPAVQPAQVVLQPPVQLPPPPPVVDENVGNDGFGRPILNAKALQDVKLRKMVPEPKVVDRSRDRRNPAAAASQNANRR